MPRIHVSFAAVIDWLSRLSRHRRLLALALTILAAAPLLVWAGFMAAVAWWPDPDHVEKPPDSIVLQDRTGVPLAALASADGQWRMTLDEGQISPHLFDAIVAVEDSRFYHHHGVDWRSVAGAIWTDLSHLRFSRGASTLTMQLQRLREPRPHSLWGKVIQAIRAEQIEQHADKRAILVEYLNRAPFGGNLVGAGAASWRYFGRPCRQLSLGQAALLAGLPQSPNHLRPDRFPDRARSRRNHVLERMFALGMITRAQRQEASAAPIGAAWRALPQDRMGAQFVVADGALPALLGIAARQSGPVIRTTLDASIQRQTARAALDHLRTLEPDGIHDAAVVVLDTRTSECRASVSLQSGGGMLDLASRPRSTGSMLKPFIYAAAFDAGVCRPDSLLPDTRTAWPGYAPNDYDRGFRGMLTCAEALAQSRNVPAMLVLERLGIEPAIGVMDALGLHGLAHGPDTYGLPLAIGGADATPLELAQAYAALGRGGIAGPIRFTFEPEDTQAISRVLRPDSCWQALAALDVPARTNAVCPDACNSHAAWKTGTSSGHRDAWCAAVTRDWTVVVWLGNTGSQPSPALVGQDAAAPLALRLIAMLEPRGAPWPPMHQTPSDTRLDAPLSSQLVIVSPAPGQQFVLRADVPAGQQRIGLQAFHRGSPSGDQGILWWFIDGQAAGQSTEGRRLWWDPVPGRHEIRVVDAHAHSARAAIFVRPPHSIREEHPADSMGAISTSLQ